MCGIVEMKYERGNKMHIKRMDCPNCTNIMSLQDTIDETQKETVEEWYCYYCERTFSVMWQVKEIKEGIVGLTDFR